MADALRHVKSMEKDTCKVAEIPDLTATPAVLTMCLATIAKECGKVKPHVKRHVIMMRLKSRGGNMGATFFTREVTEAIVTIAQEMKEANRLKKRELILKYGKNWNTYGNMWE